MTTQTLTGLFDEALFLMETDPDKALGLFEEALQHAHDEHDEKLQANILFQIGVTYHNKSDHTESLKYFSESLSSIYTETDNKLKAQLLRTIGVQYFRGFNYEEAINYFTRSLKISEEIGFEENIHMLFGCFGAVYTKLKEYRIALEYSLKSLRIAEKLNDNEMRKFSLMYVGGDYFHLNENEMSHDYLSRSLSLEGSRFAHANALYYLASLNHREGTLENAGNMADEMIAICRKHNFMEFESLGLCLVGEIFIDLNNTEYALYLLVQSTQLAERINAHTIYFRACKALIRIYESQGNLNKALEYYKILYDKHIDFLQSEANVKVRQLTIQNELSRIRSEAEIEHLKNVDLAKAIDNVHVLNESLKELNGEKNDFMAIAVHDLKNPLQNILSSARILRKNKEISRPQIDDFTLKIINQSDRMFDLIKKLLDHNAIEQGEFRINKSTFYVSSFFNDLLHHIEERTVSRRIKIYLKIDNNDAAIFTDYDILYQILENLLTNAIKFSADGKNICLNVHSSDTKVIIEVIDEGPGFTEEDMKKVFTKFAKLSAVAEEDGHSTGLGLSIVKKFAELLEGTVTLESSPGKGAKFTLTLNLY